jgi:hypothetical protein
MKNWQERISNEEKLNIISQLVKVNKLLTYCIVSGSLTAAYAQFVIMLKELQTALKCVDKIKRQQSETGSICLYSKITTVLSE